MPDASGGFFWYNKLDREILEFGQSKRNQVFCSKVFLRASKTPVIAYIWGAKGSKTWFLAASPGLSKVQRNRGNEVNVNANTTC